MDRVIATPIGDVLVNPEMLYLDTSAGGDYIKRWQKDALALGVYSTAIGLTIGALTPLRMGWDLEIYVLNL